VTVALLKKLRKMFNTALFHSYSRLFDHIRNKGVDIDLIFVIISCLWNIITGDMRYIPLKGSLISEKICCLFYDGGFLNTFRKSNDFSSQKATEFTYTNSFKHKLKLTPHTLTHTHTHTPRKELYV